MMYDELEVVIESDRNMHFFFVNRRIRVFLLRVRTCILQARSFFSSSFVTFFFRLPVSLS